MAADYDVVIVGGGNAAMSAAHAAREQVKRVLVLEKAPEQWAGGNSYFTAGAFRVTFDGLEELQPVLEELKDELVAQTDLPPYTEQDFMNDMLRVTLGRCDPELTGILVRDATPTFRWLHDKGLRFRLMYNRQAFQVNGRWQFWGGLAAGSVGGGQGLMEQHFAAARRSDIRVAYDSPVVGLIQDESGTVTGVKYVRAGRGTRIAAGAVVLAGGGFEADPRRRAAFLGPGWDLAKVRGTPYNTGDVIQMALDAGAQPFGHWSGCHAIAWDAGASPSGDRAVTNRRSRQSYPLGIMVNTAGRRFLDEGADFRNYTYAKYGAEILRQPDAIAYQLFDAKTAPLLRHEDYDAPGTTRVEAHTLEELARSLNLDAATLRQTVESFNSAIGPAEFNPAIKDGKGTVGISPRKSNWAVPLDTPPFLAFPVTCGITFTFGGLRIDGRAAVLDGLGAPIPGLFAAGELVGGLFYHNYPGGSGLTSGSVFGRRAGAEAAIWAANSARHE